MSESVLRDAKSFDNTQPCSLTPHPLYDNFGTKVTREEAISHLGLDADQRYILFFGLIRDYKGLDLLLQAFADKRLRGKKVKLLVAGGQLAQLFSLLLAAKFLQTGAHFCAYIAAAAAMFADTGVFQQRIVIICQDPFPAALQFLHSLGKVGALGGSGKTLHAQFLQLAGHVLVFLRKFTAGITGSVQLFFCPGNAHTAGFDLFFGDTVVITRSDMTTRLVRLKDEGFYSKIRMKKFI